MAKFIIISTRVKLFLSSIYSVLTELRRKFGIPDRFSVLKRSSKECIPCRLYNARTIKLDHISYRAFMLNLTNIPFSNIFVDYIGPLNVKFDYISFSSPVSVRELCTRAATEFVAGAGTIINFLNDPVTPTYFEENYAIPISFQQYYKGFSKLGLLIESCLKLVKY